jgi:hypothetical protein
MFSFKKWLTEAFSNVNAERVNELIRKYLEKKLGGKVVKMPGVEEFSNSIEKGFGIRYFYDKIKSVRFNWTSAIGVMNLHSVDIWFGTGPDPDFHIEFPSDVSIVKVLPSIVDVLQNPSVGTFEAIPVDDLNEELNISYVAESTMHDIWDEVLTYIKVGQPVRVSAIESTLGSRGYKIINAIRAEFSDSFEQQGRNVIFNGDIHAIAAAKDKILNKIGGVKMRVTKGGSGETISIDPKLKELEDIDKEGIEKVAYEDQLKDLAGLIKLVVKGASNALFIAGRGGVGKTHTVESVLGELGLKDGEGYFKNTGSASAIGIYKLLYKHRDEIILFDDSDGALADQDSRNIFKAATDTKKVRKLVWNKDSKNLVDPDEMDEDDDTKIPKYFEFTGRIIFISNLSIDKLDPDGALRTRALMISIDPTDEEVLDFMEKIVNKIPLEDGLELDESARKEVVDQMRKSTRKGDISIRKLVRGLNMRAALGPGDDWVRLVKLYA